jgi:catechol 2,3-dioxygenase-like lactoylglutathione lyase family enzyme
MTCTKLNAAKLFLTTVVLLGPACLSGQTSAAPAQTPAQAMATSPIEFSPDHATLSVADLEKEVAWYERVMGYKVSERGKRGDDFEFVYMTIPGYRIDLSWRKGSVRHHVLDTQMDQGWMHIVFTSPALDADYNQLVALKADVKANKNKDSAINRLSLHDPEGNEIEIQRPDLPTQTPAQSLGDNPLQITPHHATVSVADLDKEVDWYGRVLGFKLGQRIKIGDTAEVCHLIIPGYQIDLSWHKESVKHAVLKGDLEQGWLHIVFKTPKIDAVYNQLVAQQADVRAAKNKDSKITMVSVNDPEGNELAFQPAN